MRSLFLSLPILTTIFSTCPISGDAAYPDTRNSHKNQSPRDLLYSHDEYISPYISISVQDEELEYPNAYGELPIQYKDLNFPKLYAAPSVQYKGIDYLKPCAATTLQYKDIEYPNSYSTAAVQHEEIDCPKPYAATPAQYKDIDYPKSYTLTKERPTIPPQDDDKNTKKDDNENEEIVIKVAVPRSAATTPATLHPDIIAAYLSAISLKRPYNTPEDSEHFNIDPYEPDLGKKYDIINTKIPWTHYQETREATKFLGRKQRSIMDGTYEEKPEGWFANDMSPKKSVFDLVVKEAPRCAAAEAQMCCDELEWDEVRGIWFLKEAGLERSWTRWDTAVGLGCYDVNDFAQCPNNKIHACCFRDTSKFLPPHDDPSFADRWKIFNGDIVAGCLPALTFQNTSSTTPTRIYRVEERPTHTFTPTKFTSSPPRPILGADRRYRLIPVQDEDGEWKYVVAPTPIVPSFGPRVNPLPEWREKHGIEKGGHRKIAEVAARARETGVATRLKMLRGDEDEEKDKVKEEKFKENVTKKNVTKKNVTEKNATKKNVTEKNVTDKDVTDKNVTDKKITGKKFTDKKVKCKAGRSG